MCHFQGNKVRVQGMELHFERVGSGPHTILFLPGALGTTSTHFSLQLKGLNHDKFTLVALDPPGCGYSRPPERTYPLHSYRSDADIAALFMQCLGYQQYSVLGWSAGGVSALILAALYPKAMKKLVVWGCNSYITEEDIQLIFAVRDVKQWNPKVLGPMVLMYGKEYFAKAWAEYCDEYARIAAAESGNLCQELLPKISCSTLIIHGDKDPLISPEHPGFLHGSILGSQLQRMPEAKHNLHVTHAAEFNSIVEEFLTDSVCSSTY